MKKKFLLLLAFFTWISYSVKAESYKVFFSPASKCENNLIEQISNCKSSIDAAVYAINNDGIVKALKQAYDRGIKIRILTDKLQAANKNSRVKDLYRYGINIKVNSKFKIEHNKFAVFDGKSIVTGSFNWTTPASEKNSENCLFVFQRNDVIKEYQKRFDYLWKLNRKYKSDEWFNKRI